MAMPTPSANSCPDADVLVVGRGPVGRVLGTLLGQRGWLTTVVDPVTTFEGVAGFDAETMRVLAGLGLGPRLREIGVPGTCLEFENATLRFSRPKGWPRLTLCHQPALHALLEERARRLPNLTVLHGEAVMLVDRGPHAEVVVGGEVITASWVVGVDGMHSFHDSERRWRSGRILLAGDPAERTPLVAGPGPCAGIRDAANLAWKLDLVLRERADDSLLDTYAAEREAPSGELLPLADVEVAGVRGSFDELTGPGFVLLTVEPPDRVLTDRTRAFLHSLDTRIVHVLPAGSRDGVVDVDHVYVPFLVEAGRMAALVRPDHHLVGTARDAYDLAELVDELRSQLFRKRFRPRPIE